MRILVSYALSMSTFGIIDNGFKISLKSVYGHPFRRANAETTLSMSTSHDYVYEEFARRKSPHRLRKAYSRNLDKGERAWDRGCYSR